MTPEEVSDRLDTELRHLATNHLATREDIAQLELRLIDRMIASERGQRMWVWGLYALVIISYFVRH